MDISVLELFLDAARRGSFAAAAKLHGLDPSSASRAIASLEKSLGVSLFVRTTRKLSLTDAGEVYFRRIEPLVEELESASEAAQLHATSSRGTLRVLSPVSFGLLNLVPLLPQWQAIHPNVRIDLLLEDALLDLVADRIDVALRLGPLESSSYLSRKLTSMWPRVCASPGYIKKYGAPTKPEELKQHRCLLLKLEGFGNRWSFRDQFGIETVVDVDGWIQTSNAIAIKQLAIADAGILLQGDWIVGRELFDGSLVDLFPNHEVTASSFGNAIWLLHPQRRRVPQKTRAFIDFLIDHFREGPPWAVRRERNSRSGASSAEGQFGVGDFA